MVCQMVSAWALAAVLACVVAVGDSCLLPWGGSPGCTAVAADANEAPPATVAFLQVGLEQRRESRGAHEVEADLGPRRSARGATQKVGFGQRHAARKEAQKVEAGRRQRHGARRNTPTWEIPNFGFPATPAYDASVFAARENVFPPVTPNVTDAAWYRGDYAYDSSNALEHLSYTSPATEFSPEYEAAEKNKTNEAVKKLTPNIRAEVQEAEEYYMQNYVFDDRNMLEEFTISSDYYKPDAWDVNNVDEEATWGPLSVAQS